MLDVECCRTISHDIASENNIGLLKIILQYFPNGKIIGFICESAICLNNLEILDILFKFNYDIQLSFEIFMNNYRYDGHYYITLPPPYQRDLEFNININFTTILWLRNHDINILNFTDKICMIYINSNDLSGIKYCVENGADVNYLLREIPENIDLQIVKYLVDNGADVNELEFENIIRIMKTPEIIILLIESGLDISEYAFKLILYAMYNHNIILATYLIKFNPDLIPMEDNLLLFYATYTGNLDIVQILLDHGADIHSNNDSISLFFDKEFKLYPGIGKTRYYVFFFSKIIKLLVKNGAIINDPVYILSAMVKEHCPIDEELFNIFLNAGMDMNTILGSKCNFGSDIKYILEAITLLDNINTFKLFLKHGSDPFINSHGPLKIALAYRKSNIVKLLLELGSIVEQKFIDQICSTPFPIPSDIIDILQKYGYNTLY